MAGLELSSWESRALSGWRVVVTRPSPADGLAGALAELAADPAARLRLGALNRERVQMFEWDRLVARVRDEYVTALASRGQPSRGEQVAAAV